MGAEAGRSNQQERGMLPLAAHACFQEGSPGFWAAGWPLQLAAVWSRESRGCVSYFQAVRKGF